MRSILILLLSAILFISCSSDNDNQGQQGRRNMPVPTVEAIVSQFGTLPLEERLSGSVKAYNQTEIFPEIGAPVLDVYVNNGDRVTRGQQLIRLRDMEANERLSQAQASYRIASAQVQQAEARLNQLEAQLNRVRQLAERNLQSQVELEQLQAEVMSARASLNLSLAQQSSAESVVQERQNEIEKMVIRAPINGVVGERNAETGQFVTSNTRVFTIGDLTRMKVEVALTENMLTRIREGMRVQLSSPTLGDSVISANITRISPFLNPTTHTAVAEIEVRNDGRLLRSGMFVSVDIFYGDSEQATLIPNNALYRHPREGFEGIFVAPSLGQELNFEFAEGQEIPQIVGPTPVEFRRVEIVARGRAVSAVRGIEPQMYVVTLGHNLLVDGSGNTRVRMVDWDHILNLQQMQSRDLINIIRDRNGSRSNGS